MGNLVIKFTDVEQIYMDLHDVYINLENVQRGIQSLDIILTDTFLNGATRDSLKKLNNNLGILMHVINAKSLAGLLATDVNDANRLTEEIDRKMGAAIKQFLMSEHGVDAATAEQAYKEMNEDPRNSVAPGITDLNQKEKEPIKIPQGYAGLEIFKTGKGGK